VAFLRRSVDLDNPTQKTRKTIAAVFELERLAMLNSRKSKTLSFGLPTAITRQPQL